VANPEPVAYKLLHCFVPIQMEHPILGTFYAAIRIRVGKRKPSSAPHLMLLAHQTGRESQARGSGWNTLLAVGEWII
jgi:hypothetical protein